MSKYVKNLLIDDVKKKLAGVNDALLVSVSGLDATKNQSLRAKLRGKGIGLMVVKNSLAKQATKGTPLNVAFDQAEGSLAVVWGSADIVSLAKEVVAIAEDKTMAPFAARGGVVDGQRLSADEVKDVSKWPSREEVLGKIVGQILGPGAQLAALLLGPGGQLAGQLKTKSEGAEGDAEAAPAAAE
ncbi:MAG: 50S ribosomal protein L10 [Planctomycetales bacterium]|jgi:ribosomal protein L10|nr:50S ribosomal protein L10 [Planctomycetales bacterium]MBN8626737.1 50S ribosomal protein L10 [Planctomycetota bacterium]